jgi:hypothetical protein
LPASITRTTWTCSAHHAGAWSEPIRAAGESVKLTLERVEQAEEQSGQIVVRLLVLNDSYDVVTVDRGRLIGPNPVAARPSGLPLPISMEPTAEDGPESTVALNPWCLYGRQRTFDAIGGLTFHGYLLRKRTDELQPDGPVDADALAVAAPPLTVD